MKILETIKAFFKGKDEAPAKPDRSPRVEFLEAEDAGVAKWAWPAKPGKRRAKPVVIDVVPEEEEQDAGKVLEDFINEFAKACAAMKRTKTPYAKAQRDSIARIQIEALERWFFGLEDDVFKGFPWEKK